MMSASNLYIVQKYYYFSPLNNNLHLAIVRKISYEYKKAEDSVKTYSNLQVKFN